VVPLEMINPLMGYEKNQAITQMLHLHEQDKSKISTELVNDIHHEFIIQMIHFYQSEPGIEPLPNVEETFEALHQLGILVGINTGFSKDIAETVVNRLQWREKGLMDYLVGSDEVELGRPHPYMIHKMMDEAGITNPLEVAKVGDTEVDVREGQNAGCRYVIGVTTGIFTREELKEYHPTHIIDDIAQVLDIIRK
jgi:phosphonatase-like hydrolase